MKKGSIIALIVAAVLIIAGGMILVLGLSFAGSGAQESSLTEQEVLIPEPFTNIQINTEDCDVIILPSGGSGARVVIQQRDNVQHTIMAVDGTLQIEMQDNRISTDHIGILWEPMIMTVYLPETQYETLNIRTDTGDVKIPAEFSSKEAMLRSSTGEIDCYGKISEILDCMTSTGDISIRGGKPILTKLQSDTGDLHISGSGGRDIHMTTNTGEVDAENVAAHMFTCDSDTGEVELDAVLVEDYLQIRTTTGEVGIENCDAARVDIKTDTGDVYGNFLTPKWFSAFSDTGNVDVPSSPEGGECCIQSNTGDISFFYDGSQKIG